MAQNDKVKRHTVAQKVYAKIANSSTHPGRFVKKNNDGSYTVKSGVFALEKIKRGLSENSTTVKAYLMRRGMLNVQPINKKRTIKTILQTLFLQEQNEERTVVSFGISFK